MVWIPGGTFLMGSDHHYAEEASAHRVTVDGFWMDQYLVTNAQFQKFVKATGYVTFAERPANPEDYPSARPEMLQPSSCVFVKPDRLVDKGNHYPKGKMMANTWQGEFPWENLKTDGYERTSRVASFPANGYRLYDMIGNVWEWTTDWYQEHNWMRQDSCCGTLVNPRGGDREASYDPQTPGIKIPRKVIKGGSFLCAPSYCRRYRPPARMAEPLDTSTCHLGFRLIVRP
ncbi:MAG TPA: SUMF1/EgtB/PvdO family nonheme iron enzyme [Synechococcales cyanobacterium M55_K2018_004]|nr:SUMF1/EgtB/PvdO family nonheme iron enzyme [Synechococcales cyanobacterium M55_K2018_004]